ncbi:hypothetical protein [Pseudomonas tohonis]|uniref:hypothetical protein n=1 Tax=Pseudomonas tohonis TaxID=2725477 RepID=UPI001F30E485|nr:hypothetical protein [Pseudomonas tohonis]
MTLPDNMLDAINDLMTGGGCPTAGCLGECAAILETGPGCYQAMLYIWDRSFNDSTQVASWFHNLGAESVSVRHTLYSDDNDDRNGQAADGVQEWSVSFALKGEKSPPHASSTSSTPALRLKLEQWGREHWQVSWRVMNDGLRGMHDSPLYFRLFKPGEELDLYTSAPTHGQQTAAERDVLAERRRQVEAKDWTYDHDDTYRDGELAAAAASYAIDACGITMGAGHGPNPPSTWPWPRKWWKPSTPRRNLVKAGALILAEIERIDRATSPGLPEGRSTSAQEVQP